MTKSTGIFIHIIQFSSRMVLLFVMLHPKETAALWDRYPWSGAFLSTCVLTNLTLVADYKLEKR